MRREGNRPVGGQGKANRGERTGEVVITGGHPAAARWGYRLPRSNAQRERRVRCMLIDCSRGIGVRCPVRRLSFRCTLPPHTPATNPALLQRSAHRPRLAAPPGEALNNLANSWTTWPGDSLDASAYRGSLLRQTNGVSWPDCLMPGACPVAAIGTVLKWLCPLAAQRQLAPRSRARGVIHALNRPDPVIRSTPYVPIVGTRVFSPFRSAAKAMGPLLRRQPRN
jgi:hypothetical protein